MQYTFALLAEKLIEILNCRPLLLQAPPLTLINSTATYHRGNSSSPSCVYLIDNSKGTRPLSSCEPVHCGIYLPSSAEASSFSPSQVGDKALSEPFSSYKMRIDGQTSDRALLVLPPSVSRRQLERALTSAFTFYNEWSEGILQKIRAHEDWFSFIENAHDLLHNPMLIYDNTMKVLAYTRTDGTTDPIWTDTVASGTAHTNSPEESLELLKYIKKMEQDDKPFRHVGKGMSDPFYSCNIMANGCRIGMVTITEHNHPVTQGQLDLLWNFANLLSIQMDQENTQKHQTTLASRQLLTDLLEGNITSRTTLTTRLVAAHWDCLPMIRILRFDSTIPYMNDGQWLEGLEALAALPLHGIGSLFSDHILYIGTSETAELPDTLLCTLDTLCAKHHLRCGISDSFTDLLQVNRYGTQPALALSLSSRTICFYDEVRFANLKRHIQGYPNREELIHRAVHQLRRLDRETGSEYIKTLRALFDNQYSQVAAALALGIHRTTLFYRQQKIEELTGISLQNAQTMLHIQISLLLDTEE